RLRRGRLGRAAPVQRGRQCAAQVPQRAVLGGLGHRRRRRQPCGLRLTEPRTGRRAAVLALAGAASAVLREVLVGCDEECGEDDVVEGGELRGLVVAAGGIRGGTDGACVGG